MRAPNLTAAMVDRILGWIDSWEGPLTWRLLIEFIHARTGLRYSRTALHYHPRIQKAFSARKRLGAEPGVARLTYTQQLRASLAKERARCRRIEAERDALMEINLTMSTNAERRGVTEQQLLKPLVKIKRASRRRAAGAPPAPGFG